MKKKIFIQQLTCYLEAYSKGDKEGAAQCHPALQQFLEPSSWSILEEQEKKMVAEAFLCWGEEQLAKEASEPPSFIAATHLLPDDPYILMRQAVAYMRLTEESVLWKKALYLVQNSLELIPEEVLTRRLLGQIWERLGEKEEDLSLLEEAKKCYEEAAPFCKEGSLDFRNNLWDQAKIAFVIGRLSGEASDFYNAIENYKKVEELGEHSLLFFIDFGHAYESLASLIKREELRLLALGYFQKAAFIGENHFEAQLQLAYYSQILYEDYHDEKHFLIASCAFDQAAAICPADALCWCKYAMLLALHGKRIDSKEEVEAGLQFFAKAHLLEPLSVVVLASWSEVLLTLGMESESYEWLRQAEQNMEKAVALCPGSGELWAIYGYCLNELGNYFNEESYYHRAIEKLEKGVEADPSNPKLFHGIALSQLAIGMIRADKQFFEVAAIFFKRACLCDKEPYFADFWVDWGISLMRLGEISMDRSHVVLALEKFEFAIKLQTGQNSSSFSFLSSALPIDWLYNYGCALDFLGDFDADPSYYERAIRILSFVLESSPSFTNARYNLALALFHLGELVGDVDCFYLAAEQFKWLVENDPEDSQAYEEWGEMLLHQSLMMQDPAKLSFSDELLIDAEKKLVQATLLGSTDSIYTLACLYSIKGEYERGMHYIIKAAEKDALPSIDDLMHDEWLEGLRSLPHFRRLLLELAAKQTKD